MLARELLRIRHPSALNRRDVQLVERPLGACHTAVTTDVVPFASADNTLRPTFAAARPATRLTLLRPDITNIQGALPPSDGPGPHNTDQLLPEHVDPLADTLRNARPRAAETPVDGRLGLLLNTDHIRRLASKSFY